MAADKTTRFPVDALSAMPQPSWRDAPEDCPESQIYAHLFKFQTFSIVFLTDAEGFSSDTGPYMAPFFKSYFRLEP